MKDQTPGKIWKLLWENSLKQLKLEGTKVEIDGKEYATELYCLLDLCALNCLIGKQNHSSTFPCAWTNVDKKTFTKSERETTHTRNL